MDWIEELTGLSPDAGSGMLEVMIVGTLAAVILLAVFSVRSQRQSRVRRHL